MKNFKFFNKNSENISNQLTQQIFSLPSFTDRSLIGKRFLLSINNTMFCLNIQKRIVIETPTIIEIEGLANGTQYFCKEIYHNRTTRSWNEDIEIQYFVDFLTIQNGEEIISN